MNSPNAQIETAIQIAVRAHEGQVDKGGLPYVLHPLAVMGLVVLDGLEARKIVTHSNLLITAVLHDVVEDTEWTFDELEKAIGFDKEVIDALRLLTHEKGVAYMDYVQKIKNSGNEIARLVKIADLRHNTSGPRIQNIKDSQIKKYAKALTLLLN